MFRRCVFLALNAALYLRHPRFILRFRRKIGFFPDIAAPVEYTERMLWRKVFDHNPLFHLFSDKLATKAYVHEHAPTLRVPATLWVARTAEEAMSHLSSAPVVIKASHGCGFNHFYRGAEDRTPALERKMRGWLTRTYGRRGLQWGYVGLQRRIFAEPFIEAPGPHGLIDINVRCADGRPMFCSVLLRNKTDAMACEYYDVAGQWLDLGDPPTAGMGPLAGILENPQIYLDAVAHAARLSDGIDYARFDFLTDGVSSLYGGEITVYPSAGWSAPSRTGEFERLIDASWDLQKSWFLRTPHRGWRGVYARALARWLDERRPAATRA